MDLSEQEEVCRTAQDEAARSIVVDRLLHADEEVWHTLCLVDDHVVCLVDEALWIVVGLCHRGQVVQVDVQVIGEYWLVGQQGAFPGLPSSGEDQSREHILRKLQPIGHPAWSVH